MTLEEEIAFFFAPPLPLQSGATLSTLHLLPREAQDCLIGDVVHEDAVVADRRRHRLFATTMVLMAGIDLLAKFYAGDDSNGKAGERIKDFASRFIFNGAPSATEPAEVLSCGCRNPMLHSFTSHNAKYRITLTSGFADQRRRR